MFLSLTETMYSRETKMSVSVLDLNVNGDIILVNHAEHFSGITIPPLFCFL